MHPRTAKSGYSFLEILVVVVIVGVVAAIAIAHFTGAGSPGEDNRDSALLSQVETLRAKIEHYKAQHKHKLPDLVTDWTQLTTRTDGDGAPSNTTDAFGPYLQAAPVNPLNGLSNVIDGDILGGATPEDCGFIYDYKEGTGTGRIWATGPDKRFMYGN